MPRMANLGKAVPPVVVLVLLLSGQRMTTVRPASSHTLVTRVPRWSSTWARLVLVAATHMDKKAHGTFANFVSGELVGLVLDILDCRQVEVTGDSSILFIKELHCLSCNVNHAWRSVDTPVSEPSSPDPYHLTQHTDLTPV